MCENDVQEETKTEVTKRLEYLIAYIKSIERTEQRRTSIIFCITNLILQSCDVIEGLGLLEIIKGLLTTPSNTKENINKLKSHRLYYIT